MNRLPFPARLAVTACLGAGLAACGEHPPATGSAGPEMTVAVAALTLPGITDASYNLRVHNADAQLVWERLALTSGGFGDGAGALTFVGPCDADASPNTVTLELASLTTQSGPLPESTYVNPCPPGDDDCQLTVACEPNADAAVRFDIAIMRDAEQGFFDVAVNFEDVFCSAKLDCVDRFLHDADGERGRTAIFAFACTSGDDQATHLYLDDVVLACDGQAPITVDPSGGPGNLGAHPPSLFQAATYRGREDLGGASLEKCYWNTALGLDDDALGDNCTLTLAGTAAPTSWEGGASPPGTVWPVVRWHVDLTDGDGDLTCGAHALDDEDGVVTTSYTGVAGRRFRHVMRCADQTVETPGVTRCQGTVSAFGDVTVDQSGLDVTVSSAAGGDSAIYTLPAGLSVVGCCPDGCCDEGGPQ